MADSGNEMFRCIVCQITFSRESAFKMHQLGCYWATKSQKTEIEVKKKFTCEECGKDFMSKFHLKAHVTIHTTRNHQCGYCGTNLSSKSSLQRHMTLHNDKKFKCKECGKYFALRDSQNKHNGLRNCTCEECEDSLRLLFKCVSTKRNMKFSGKSNPADKNSHQSLPELKRMKWEFKRKDHSSDVTQDSKQLDTDASHSGQPQSSSVSSEGESLKIRITDDTVDKLMSNNNSKSDDIDSVHNDFKDVIVKKEIV